MTTTTYIARRTDPGALAWTVQRVLTGPTDIPVHMPIAWTIDQPTADLIAHALNTYDTWTTTPGPIERYADTIARLLRSGRYPAGYVLDANVSTAMGDAIAAHPHLVETTTADDTEAGTRRVDLHPNERHTTRITSEQMTDLVGTPGTFARLEGGTLDLGGVTPDQAQDFAEEFEGTVRLDGEPVAPGPIPEDQMDQLMAAAEPLVDVMELSDVEPHDAAAAARHLIRQLTTGTYGRVVMSPEAADLITNTHGADKLRTVGRTLDGLVEIALTDKAKAERVLSYPWLAPGQVSHGNAGSRSAQLIGCLRAAGMNPGPPAVVLVDETTADRLMTVPGAPDHLHDATLRDDAEHQLRRLMLAEHVARLPVPRPRRRRLR